MKTDIRIHKTIGDAYAKFDSDPRVGGRDNFEAFADAVEAYCEEATRLAESDFSKGFDLGYQTGVEYAYETSWHKAEALAEELRGKAKAYEAQN